MNFDLEHDRGRNHDENHEEEEDADDTTLAPTPLNYDTTGAHPPPRAPLSATPATESKKIMATKYRECLKNHAVSIGGHATDGCGEFMPAGDDGTLDALKCAACGCHRNFHRRNIDDEGDQDQHSVSHVAGGSSGFYQNPLPLYYHRGSPPLHVGTPGGGGGIMVPVTSPVAVVGSHHHLHQRPLTLLSSPYCGDETEEDLSRPNSSGGGSGLGKKRFRTKFTQEQKEKMTGFAERIGWKIQKHDEAEAERFCEEVKVKRQVLKVWIHNNKHTIGKIT